MNYTLGTYLNDRSPLSKRYTSRHSPGSTNPRDISCFVKSRITICIGNTPGRRLRTDAGVCVCWCWLRHRGAQNASCFENL